MMMEVWNDISYMVELLGACVIFMLPLRRKKGFAVRSGSMAIFLILLSYIINSHLGIPDVEFIHFVYWASYLVVSVVYIWVCMKGALLRAAYYTVFACAVQHIAYDLYLIFNECIKHEEFVQVISAQAYDPQITGADGNPRSVEWEPTNFYATGEASRPESVTLVGGKTGTTKLAGNCLILLSRDSSDQPYISVVMGADTKELLYQDMTTILNTLPADNPADGQQSSQ